MGTKPGGSFYLADDVVQISRALLGKALCSNIGGKTTKVIITETEAYAGVNDKASHAYGDKRTKRTEVMYAEGGRAYIYLCYGIHHLFNVVTNVAGVPHAVLIRAGSPLEGIEEMLIRRDKKEVDRKFLAGPGSLSKALGITTQLSGTSLQGNNIWIEDHGFCVSDQSIQASPRIGIDYAGEDAARPYRFVLESSIVHAVVKARSIRTKPESDHRATRK